MKRIILVATFFLAFTSFTFLNAQWTRTFFIGAINNMGYSIQQTNDGGYIVLYSLEGAVVGYLPNVCLLKLDTHGEIEWQHRYGERTQQVEAYSIKQTSDGGYIVAGYTCSFGAGEYDFWILKLDSNGVIEWQKTYGGSHRDLAYSIQQTNDGGYIVAGHYSPFGPGGDDIWVLKLSSNGDIEWERTYRGNTDNRAYSIQQTNDGGYIVSGYSGEFESGQEDIWVLKLFSNGDIEWQRTYGGDQADRSYSIKQTIDGGYIIAGYTSSFGAGQEDIWVLKLFSHGDIEWQRTYGGIRSDEARSIKQTDDGGYIIAGYTESFSPNAWILKLSSNGDIEWQKNYGAGDYYDGRAESIQQTTDGGFIFAGHTREPWERVWLLVSKISSNGDIDPSCGDNVQESNAISLFTSITPVETNIEAHSINITPENTNITYQETNAIVDLICEYTPSISGYVKTAAGARIEGVNITFSNEGGTATTDSNGNYSNRVSDGWSGTATPSKTGYTFSPSSRSYTDVTSDKIGEDYIATLLTYTILGTASVEGSGLSGVVMNGLPGNPTTDTSGNYSDTVDYDWSGTVTPSKAGYNFSPSSQSYTNVIADKTNQDYTATLNIYTLTTNVNPSGGGHVTKNPDKTSYTHGDTVELTADANTGYTFSGWTGDVPLGHENDNPITITMDSNKTITANFTIMTYTISGTVTFGGSGVEGVLIDGLPGDPTSNNSGYYTATVDYSWLGTATPSKAGYTFSPSSRTYTNVTTDQTDQDYTVIIYTLTTQINPSGGGSITKNPDKPLYKQTENVELTANANSGYTFTGWTGDVPSGHESDNPVTITIDADKSITANFWKKGPCFIATAAYGSPLHYYVRILQKFRDKYLMPSKLGSKLVNFYYKYSPFFADLIARHKVLKVMVRFGLLPVIVFSYSMVHLGPIIAAVILGFIFVLPILFVLFYRRN